MEHIIVIREYDSTLYVGMAPKTNGRPYISIAIDELKSLVIYTDKFYLIIMGVARIRTCT